jgi:hypothetical protein
MLRPTWNDLKLRIRRQVQHLARHPDPGLVSFCAALLALDGFFIVVFAAHRIYTVLYDNGIPVLGDQWHIGYDASYAEMLGYLKLAIIVAVLSSIRGRRQRPIYLAFALIFTVVLLDDVLQLHERLGRGLADALGLQALTGRTGSALGQLVVWMMAGLFLLTGALAAFIRSSQEDRTNGVLLIGGLTLLGLFVAVVDGVHVVARRAFGDGDLLFTVIEEGGEQLTLSLTCGLALLIRRELRSRPTGKL